MCGNSCISGFEGAQRMKKRRECIAVLLALALFLGIGWVAGQLLMPEQIISTLQSRYVKIDADYLKRIFGVSADAAERKIRTLKRATKGWRSEEECGYDAIIKTKFADFITRSIPASHQTMLFPDYEEVFSRQQERDRWLSMR